MCDGTPGWKHDVYLTQLPLASDVNLAGGRDPCPTVKILTLNTKALNHQHRRCTRWGIEGRMKRQAVTSRFSRHQRATAASVLPSPHLITIGRLLRHRSNMLGSLLKCLYWYKYPVPRK